MRLRRSPILALALPSVVSNITVPLLGLADTAIVGHMGEARFIGAIAIGNTIFSLVYWLFAFLRIGTTGLTSQAYGAGDGSEVRQTLRLSLALATGIAFLILLLQVPLFAVASYVMRPEEGVAEAVYTYFHTAVWGAPAVLGGYGLTGWFVGCQNTRIPMWAAILQNLSNVLFSLSFVYGLHWGVAGVAAGTVLGLYLGFSFLLWHARAAWLGGGADVFRRPWQRFFRVNRDIFLRTLCLVCVTVCFTAAGSRQGGGVLEANALLMQFFVLFSYFMDGLANAGEALSGKYAGAGRRRAIRVLVRRLFLWAWALGLLFAVVYTLQGEAFVHLLTDQANVRQVAQVFLPWVWVLPLFGLSAFVWDGIFIGLTLTRGMLLSMLASSVLFFALWFALKDAWGNHALWLAFDAYLLTRGLVQWRIMKRGGL